MAGFLKDRYFWYIAVLAVFAGTFAYAPDVAALIQLSTHEAWELAYYVALYRFLFLASVAIAAWRFGVKGGLTACFALGPIILSIVIVNLWEPNAWLDIGVIIIGIIFSYLIGKQGEVRTVLEKTTEELRRQAAKLSLEITERKQAEETLRESERRYRLLAENATDVIWAVDINSPERLTYISPSVTRLLGYSVNEAVAKKMEEVFTPASFKIAMKALTEELVIENTEKKDLSRSRTLELDLNRKDGSVVPVEINCSFVRDSDGRAIKILVMARDITERRLVEDELRVRNSAIASSITAIALANLEGSVTYVNSSFLDYGDTIMIGKFSENRL